VGRVEHIASCRATRFQSVDELLALEFTLARRNEMLRRINA
jgi:hypothetical protein